MSKFTYRFADGSTRELDIDPAKAKEPGHPVVIGLDPEGRVVVRYGYGEGRQSWTFGLTLCCNASDKGAETGVVCRGCYDTVDVGSYDPQVVVPLEPTAPEAGNLPELVDHGFRGGYRLFAAKDAYASFDYFRSHGVSTVVRPNYSVSTSSLCRVFSSDSVVEGDDGKHTLSVRYCGEPTSLDGKKYDDAEDARRAAFEGGALAFMWYEDDRLKVETGVKA